MPHSEAEGGDEGNEAPSTTVLMAIEGCSSSGEKNFDCGEEKGREEMKL